MSVPDPKDHHTASWITSLAISITCCSILFVIFAGYISDWKESLVAMRVRFEAVTERMNEMTSEMDNLRHREQVQQIQILPTPGNPSIQLPVSVTPSPQEGQTPAQPAAQPNPAPAAAPAPGAATPATPAVNAPKPAPDTQPKH